MSGLATTSVLTAGENKIPNINSLIEKKLTDHNHDKYITTPDFNTLAADVFNARLKQADFLTKTAF